MPSAKCSFKYSFYFFRSERLDTRKLNGSVHRRIKRKRTYFFIRRMHSQFVQRRGHADRRKIVDSTADTLLRN